MSTTVRARPTTTKTKRDIWTFRPPDDVKNLVARALKELGVDLANGEKCTGLRTLIVVRAIRAGLAKHAKKKDFEIVRDEVAA